MDYSENYLNWIKENEITGLTRTQYMFAEWCFDNYKVLNQIGDLDSIFISVRNFIKTSNKFNIPDEKE
jgi:hypothetical protein